MGKIVRKIKLTQGKTSRFKGVYFDKARNKWTARLGRKFLGRFDYEEDAYEVRQKAENVML